MQFFQELLKYIGGATVLFGAIGVLTKILVSHFLEKEKVRFKSELEQTAFVYQTRFTRLHDERAKVIASLYERICSVSEATKEALYFKNDDAFKERYKECADKALEDTKSLRVFARTNKIYFSGAVAGRLDYFVNTLRHVAEVHSMEAMKAVRYSHKDGDKYYFQLVSNAIINDCKFAELIIYMPYQSEIPEIKLDVDA